MISRRVFSPRLFHTASLLRNVAKVTQPKVLTQETVHPDLKKPVPINVEMNYYAPLKNPVTYGDLKCDVTMRCYDTRNLDFFIDFSLRAGYYLGLCIKGPNYLPKKRERWTVIRAPFVHAKSKENFERRTFSRLLKVYDTNPEVIELWLSFISKHAVDGVGVKAHMHVSESLGYGAHLGEKLDVGSLDEEVESVAHMTDASNGSVALKVEQLLKDPEFQKHVSKRD